VVSVATIYLAGLPAVYTILTAGLNPAGGAAAGWRKPALPLFLAWCVCAIVLAAIAFLKDGELRSVFETLRTRASTLRGDRRREAVVRAISLVLENGPEAQLLRNFSPRVFIASPTEKPTELVPFLSTDIRTWQHWPLATGAIGLTFKTNSPDPLVFRRSELATLNRTLTTEQLEHYEGLTMVAAIAIRDDAERPLGVLSVSSSAAAPRFGDRRLRALKLLASNLGVFLELVV